MKDLIENTLADLHTLGSHPPRLRRMNTQLVRVPPPAAGSGYTYPITGTWWERILAVTVTLATASAAGQRALNIQYTDGDGIVFDSCPLVPMIGPSSTVTAYADQGPTALAPAPATVATFGSATDPAAGGAVSGTLTLQPGSWQLSGQAYLSGTVTSADATNMQVNVGAAALIPVVYPGTAGVLTSYSAQITLTTATTVGVVATAAASGASAVYNASIQAIPLSGAGAQAQIPDLTLKSGWHLVIAGTNLQAADQLSNIAVLTERYPSNWADGALGSDEERQSRQLMRWLASEAEGM